MKLLTLIAGLLALACATLAQAGTPIGVNGIPFKAGMTVDHRDFGSAYRVLDDPKGEITGGRFTYLTAIPGRGGYRTSGDAHDFVFDHNTLAQTGSKVTFAASGVLAERTVDCSGTKLQNGTSFPGGYEIQGTSHDGVVSNSTADCFRMVLPPYKGNGDGFVTEAGAYRISFIGDSAFFPTDGCFDNKGHGIQVIRGYCVGAHRSQRVWTDVTSEDFTSINPGELHYWLGGAAHLTLVGTPTLLSTTTAPLFGCGGTICYVDATRVKAWRVNVPHATKVFTGNIVFTWGPAGPPSVTQDWVKPPPPPPVVLLPLAAACAPAVLVTKQAPPNKGGTMNTKLNGVPHHLVLAPAPCDRDAAGNYRYLDAA